MITYKQKRGQQPVTKRVCCICKKPKSLERFFIRIWTYGAGMKYSRACAACTSKAKEARWLANEADGHPVGVAVSRRAMNVGIATSTFMRTHSIPHPAFYSNPL